MLRAQPALLLEEGADRWNVGIVAGLQRRLWVGSFPGILPITQDRLRGGKCLVLQVGLLLSTL